MSLSNIIEGWRNHLIPKKKMKGIIEKASKERLSICEECPQHSKFHNTNRIDDHCTVCGCSLVPKTKCLSCRCPEDKWVELSSLEEEEQIKKEYENE